MTTAEALTAVKNRLYITGTDFDTQLTDYFDTAVDRLYPKVQQEVAAQNTNAVVDVYGEANVDLATLTTPLDDVRLVEATQGQSWYPADSIYRHGTILRVRDLESTVTQLKLYGLKAYVVSGSAVALPERYELPVLWFMMSEFFDMLAGNKAKFNVYQQSAGGNAVDDMRAESEYYENKANAYIDEKATLYGSQ
jgi:hypothetical protein